MKFSCALVFAVILSGVARADMYMVCRQAGAIAPTVSNDVCMESEIVKLAMGDEDGYKVEATFVLKNTSGQSVTSLVAFPILELPGFVLKHYDHDFHVEVGKREGNQAHFQNVSYRSNLTEVAPSDTAIREMMIHPPKQLPHFPKNIVWDMTWAAGETRLVRLHYTTEVAVAVPDSTGCTAATQLTYIVSTGNLWKGRIGKADFYFDLDYPKSTRASERTGPTTALVPDPNMLLFTSYPDSATWTGTSKVEWHFHDWAPSDEIFMRWVVWHDIPKYDDKDDELYLYTLQDDYNGRRELYSSGYLDRLLSEETILAKQYFPRRLTEIQTRRLRLWISEWLLHEIFARNGQIFDPVDHYETSGGNRYPVMKGTRWGIAFAQYSWHGGWYRPNRQVKESELNNTERANLVFLRNEISKLKE